MAYFPDRSKESAGKLLAREINLTPGLLDALRPTGNPEGELSTTEKNQLKRRTAPPRNASLPAGVYFVRLSTSPTIRKLIIR